VFKHKTIAAGLLAASAALTISSAVFAQSDARVRVVHASPDAPAVDVYVNGNETLSDVGFFAASNYLSVPAGAYDFQVTPAGSPASDAVIDAQDVALAAGQDYTVVAVNTVANIEPLVLEDNNAAPAAGKAHVRFVHASPDAPAVDIKVAGGPTIFSNIAFKGVGTYTPVDAGTYNLQVTPAGASDVVLDLPNITLEAGTVYTVFATGLAGGTPALSAEITVDAQASAPAAPAASAPAQPAPQTLPTTSTGETSPLLWVGALAMLLAAAGLLLRRTTR
jgi:LPXTG-motif cell wall-anchored protein